jgi:hypothetical protein
MMLSFQNDPKLMARIEDAVLSWTFQMFMTIKSDQPEWIIFMPMIKVVQRANCFFI